MPTIKPATGNWQLATGPKIMGIDPGFDRVGVAIITGARGKESLIFSCCLETSKKDAHEKRLAQISGEIIKIIKKYKPSVLAIEKLFFNKNINTAIKVAEGRGVILGAASRCGIKVFEYTPQEIKMSVTGYGNASKDDVAFIISKTMAVPKTKNKRLDDELDAIAIALTHSLKKNYPQVY